MPSASRKATSTTPPSQADLGVAVLSADAFRAQADIFIRYAAADFASASQRAAANIGGMIASATNLVLAIELYMKALLWHRGLPAPKTHELPTLFSSLPAETQRSVETAYDRLRSNEPPGTADFAVHITKPNDGPPSFARSAMVRPLDLRAILQRNSSAFVTWRYLFTQGVTPNAEPFVYEFLRLGFIATALSEHLPVAAALGRAGT